MRKITFFRNLIVLVALLVGSGSVMGQPWVYNFGTGTGTFTSSTASTSFLPAPPSGTARVRVGTNPGSFVLANPGLAGLGSDTELQFTSNTGSTSTSKFSVYDYTAGKEGYVKFKVAFSGGTNGVYKFSLGDGATYSDNNAVSANQTFAGVEWTLGASNTISYKVLSAGTYGTAGISDPATLFVQSTSTIYEVEVYANNTTAPINYDRSGTTYALTNATWDLWVNGTRVGTGLAKGNLGADVNIDSYSFNHQNSASAPGTIYIDDIEYSNLLPIPASQTVFTPTISVSGVAKATDTYFNTAQITLESATEGASIYYTTNGDAPTTSSTLYATPFSVTTTTTIKALAVKAEMDDSNVTEKTITIVAPATATIPYTEAFNNTLSDWYTYEVAGAKPWLASVDGALGNGFAGGDVESWLISPKFTATEDGLALSFNYASRFVGNPILVKVSTDYIGYGTPTAATWTTASSISAPEVQDNDYTVKASGNIITLNEGTVYFALVYDNDAAPYSDWRITNANVVLPPSSPTITVTQGSVPAMSAEVGSTDAEIITVNGLNLTGNIALAVTGTDASLFTLSTYSIAPTEGNVTDQSVTITYTPTAAGSHTATLTLSSTGAEDVVRSLSASSIWPPLSAPVATDATAISQTGFQANWNAVNGATAYDLSVYTKEVGTSANLVVNSGFESGEATPWVFESAMNQEVVTTVVKSGTYALKTAVIATKNLNQTITVVNGKEYKLSFWYYIDGASTGNGFRVWTTSGATINLPSTTTYFNTKGSWQYVETTFTASANVLVLNLRTYNGCTLYLDDFELTTDETTITPISGSPFTVTGETSKAITGLTASTTYYYTVKAENVNVESAVSNEISVVTSFGTANQNPSITQIFAHNSQIRFSATAGEQVEVYNAVGQKVISTLATDGQNVLNVREKGVMIVKVGDRMAKVIL
ncbi:MAG: chitobiase/beta-hexosaminidase C-terminal domain-containing protein [Paludibacter sp.]|nr:chitobiase/beta-hexosaminidase C-terminal domain-containing protein [Paludibacter sp.]